jgi:hypothetical protein
LTSNKKQDSDDGLFVDNDFGDEFGSESDIVASMENVPKMDSKSGEKGQAYKD